MNSRQRRLGVSTVLKQAWHTLQEYRAHFIRLTLLAGSVPALALLGAQFIAQAVPAGQKPSVTGSILYGLLFVVCWTVVFSMLAVACHRCVLLAERAMEFAQWAARMMEYVGQTLLIVLVILVPGMILYFFFALLFSFLPKTVGGEPIATVGIETLSLLGSLPIAYFAGRFSLVLPAVATDRKLTLGEAWSASKANGWRLALLTMVIPVGLPMAVNGIASLALDNVEKSVPAVGVGWAIFSMYLQTLGIVIGVVLLSTCFRELEVAKQPASEATQ